MNRRQFAMVCIGVAIGFAGAMAHALNKPDKTTVQGLAPFEFEQAAAPTPDAAAQSLFLGVATASPRDFVKHLLLGVCQNEIDLLQDFAESMHVTRFNRDGEAFTYYEMREKQYAHGTETTRLINRKTHLRVLASAAFDTSDPRVKALELEAATTYAGKQFVCVDVAGMGYDGLEYQARIVVAQADNGWYAIPRTRSSRNFYQVADAMQVVSVSTAEMK